MLKSKIGELVKASNLKREYFIKEMNVSVNTFSNWCTGKNIPSLENAFKLADLLGVKVDDLYESKKEEEN